MAHKKIVASVVGSTFYHGAGNLLQRLRPGNPLRLVRQPQNKYDKNAIGVFWSNTQLGHIPRALAAELAPLIDAGIVIKCLAANGAYVLQLEWDEPDAVVQ
jgi:SWI/SNF-related matrix-associated actin-dependent regulator of chromatin subfamily A3